METSQQAVTAPGAKRQASITTGNVKPPKRGSSASLEGFEEGLNLGETGL